MFPEEWIYIVICYFQISLYVYMLIIIFFDVLYLLRLRVVNKYTYIQICNHLYISPNETYKPHEKGSSGIIT